MRGNPTALSFLFVVALAACSKGDNVNAHSCYDAYMCTENGAIIKWQAPAVGFTFDDTVPTNLRKAMHDASQDYNDVFNTTSLAIDPDNKEAPHYNGDYDALNKDGVNSIYYVKGPWPWETRIPGSLAVTLTRFSSDGILEADVFVKGDATKIESTSNDYDAWVKYISEHELGHALGRTHSKNKTSVMYPSISLTKVNAITEETDYKDFFSAYDLSTLDLAYKLKAALLTSAN